MARLFFATSFLFALTLPLGAQNVPSVTLSVCNAGKADVDMFAARGNPAVIAHIVPNTCTDVYSETAGVPASLGFVFTDTRGQWSAPRRLDLLPDFGPNALAKADGNVTVRRGNQNVTAPMQLLFRPAIPHCGIIQLGPTTSNSDGLSLNSTPLEVARAQNADAAKPPTRSVTVCDHFVYRLYVAAYPDTREVSFEKGCAKCPITEAVRIPLPDAAAERAMLEMAATGKTSISTGGLLGERDIQGQPRPESQPMTWPVLLPALARTGRTGGLPPGIPRDIVFRGTVSRVEVSAPGSSVQWVDVSFREAPDTPDSKGKLYGEFNVCGSNSDIFQDVFGADFRTSMIGKAIEVEGEIQRSYCQGLKGSIRITLAHQVRFVKSALFDAATLAAVAGNVPAPPVPPKEPYHDPTMPNYDIANLTVRTQLDESCRRLYNPPTLTAEQIQFRNANLAAINAEVQKCASNFDVAEVVQHRRIAIRYCLANDYTLARASSKVYDECMQKNDVLTALCSAELKSRVRTNSVPNTVEQKCPAPAPNSREILVIRNGTPLDGEVKPAVMPAAGPGLPAILLAPMEPGMIKSAGPPVAVPAPPVPAVKGATPAAPVASAPSAQQRQQTQQQRAQQYTACLQQAGKDYPRGSADLTKAVTACAQILRPN